MYGNDGVWRKNEYDKPIIKESVNAILISPSSSFFVPSSGHSVPTGSNRNPQLIEIIVSISAKKRRI